MKQLRSIIGFVILGIIFSISASSCNKELNADNLQNRTWVCVAVENETDEFEPVEEITLEFISDEEGNGSGGCNAYWLEYSIDGNNLETSGFTATELACTGEKGLQETIYFDLIIKAKKIKLVNDLLTIECDGGELEFEEE
jgi:heat shock protein HslJ